MTDGSRRITGGTREGISGLFGPAARLAVAAVIFLSSFPQASFAAEAPLMGLEQLFYADIPIAVASTKKETVLNSVSTVSVIDQDKIREYNFQTVSEAVASVPGMDVIRTNFVQGVAMSRGILSFHYNNKTLIMINNVPSWHVQAGEGFVDRVDIKDVERIEVLKGPASVLYGTNAYSGVVNIVLKDMKREGHGASIHIGAGTENSFKAGANLTSLKNGLSLFMAANASDEDGHDYLFQDQGGRQGLVKDVNDPKGGNATFNAKWRGHTFLFNKYKDSYMALDGTTPLFSSGAGQEQNREGYLASYGYEGELGDKFSFKFLAGHDWNSRDYAVNESTPIRRIETFGHRTFSSLKTNTAVTPRLDVELGFDYEYRILDDFRNFVLHTNRLNAAPSGLVDRNTYEYSGFGQVGYDFGRVKALAGVRQTRNRFARDNVSARGTLVYPIDERNSLKLIAGQSYRAPATFEVFNTGNPRGNRDLKPETSDSLELVYLRSTKDLFLQVLGYHVNYKNKIERRLFILPSTTKYFNGDEFQANGLELEVNYRNPRIVNGFLNASVMDGAGEFAYENNFRYVSEYTLRAGLSRNLGPRLSVSGVVNHRAGTEGRLLNIPPYTWGDLALTVNQHEGKVRHVLSVKNVTDREMNFPEYAQNAGTLNYVPSSDRRRFMYMVNMEF